jgi:aldose 1-epimerase
MRRPATAVLKAICLIVAMSSLSNLWAQSHSKEPAKDTVNKTVFGKLDDGTVVDQFTLKNSSRATVKIITYGATVTELWVPDRKGKPGDVVLGFDGFDGYVRNPAWFGAIVGRVANRTAKGKFTLEGKEYSLEINNPPNNLHSGLKDLSRVVWKGEVVPMTHGTAVRFTYLSPDGDEGFPGNLALSVTYTLTDGNELKLNYSATTDKATPVNLTNHSYFNLGGGADILHDIVYLNADRYTPVDATQIPTGEIAPVKGTPLDFTKPAAIGARIADVKGGYDHNFVLNGESGKLKLAARVVDLTTGRQIEVWTTEPGIQFYTGNSLDGSLTGKGGIKYAQHAGLCFEAQHFPDSVNQPKFPSIILQPGSVYRQETIYKFSVK